MLKEKTIDLNSKKLEDKDLSPVSGGILGRVQKKERSKSPSFMGWTCPKCGESNMGSHCGCGYSRG